jgi:ligand-binding sensor domain-containing protein/signal transduction histidine kinase
MIIRSIVLLATVMVVSADAYAQRLPLQAYTRADGLTGENITALLSDSRGFLWVGTNTGLSRFDGREFRGFSESDGLPHPWINALLEDRGGVIWVATHRGLVRIEPQARVMSAVPLPGAAASPNVRQVIQLRDGRIVATDRTSCYIFPNEHDLAAPTRVLVTPPTKPPPSGEALWHIESLAEGKDGDLWIGTTWGLVHRLRDGRLVPIPVRPTAQDDRIAGLTVDQHGRVWITHWGIAHRPGVHFGLYILAPETSPQSPSLSSQQTLHARATHVDGARDHQPLPLPAHPGEAIYMTAGGPIGDARVHTIRTTANGTLWVGTEEGMLRIAQDRVTRYDGRNGLGLPIQSVLQDARGDVWIGTRGRGLLRLEMDGLVTYGPSEGVPVGTVQSLLEDDNGTLCLTGTDTRSGRQFFGTFDRVHDRIVTFVPKGTEHVQYWSWGWQQLFLHDRAGEWWVPSGEGLFRYPASPACTSIAEHAPTAVYTHRDGLPIDEIFRLFEDSRGDLWMSVDQSTVRWIRARQTFEVVPGPFNAPTVFVEDRSGTIWIGFFRGGLGRWRGSGAIEVLGARDGIPDGRVETMFLDARGRLWIGTDGGGLVCIEDTTAAQPRAVRGPRETGITNLPTNMVIEDRQQRLYISTVASLLRFDAALAHVRAFLTVDGLASHEVHSAYLDRYGSLWFGTHAGLSRLDPKPDPARAPPTIFIDSLRIGGVPQPLAQLGVQAVDGLTIEPDNRRLEIGYGSAGLAPGETRRYQVRLREADAAWGPATTDRTALYLNLAPGRYRFEARAVDNDGIVSEQPAVVAFTILPPIWQRAWFRVLVVVAIVAAAYATYRSRIGHLLALERMRSRIATDLHDDLGARLSRISILSEVVARRVSSDATTERLLGEVGDTARSLLEATSDITWSVDPRQDDFASLAARIRRFAADMLDGCNLCWSFEVPEDGTIKLSPECRRHVLLVFQEAITNVVRHAQAREVRLRLDIDGNHLKAEITDDGLGLDATQGQAASDGRGLYNMRTRARDLGGTLTITSPDANGRGTSVHLIVPIR